MFANISANELAKLLASGKQLDLIDVRTPIEYRAMHVASARNVPLDQLDPHVVQASRTESCKEPLYIVCRSGGRSRQACEKLVAAGVANVINVDGGTMACAAANVPIVKGKSAMPLHCQVQIITGVTVVAGAAATLMTGSLFWLALPLVMGAGLVFSGLTDTCAMGTVLAKMPWNQVTSPTSSPVSHPSNKTCANTATGCCK